MVDGKDEGGAAPQRERRAQQPGTAVGSFFVQAAVLPRSNVTASACAGSIAGR